MGNVERDAQSDKSLKELAAIHADMRQGKNGFGSFRDTDGNEGLFYIFPVRVVLAVKQADAVGADEVAPLKAVHADPLVHNGPLVSFIHGSAVQLQKIEVQKR